MKTIAEIADAIRAMHPDATAVQVFVSYDEVTVEVKRHQPRKGDVSWRRVDGKWAEPTTAGNAGP
jgi:hypothetical protein